MQLFRSCRWMPNMHSKGGKNFNLWLATLSQLYIFMQIFRGIHAVIYYCKRGCNTRKITHTKKCIQSMFTFPIHLFIMQIFFCTCILMCRLYIIRFEKVSNFSFKFFPDHHQMANGKAFRKTWRVNLYILCTFVYFSAFDSTLKWVKFEFQKKIESFFFLNAITNGKWVFRVQSKKKTSNKCIIVWIQIKSALLAYSARIDLVHWHSGIPNVIFTLKNKIKKLNLLVHLSFA